MGKAISSTGEELKRNFAKSLTRSMVISAAIICPIALAISGVVVKWHGIASAAVGLAIAGAHSILALRIVLWALQKPPQMLPTLLLGSYALRMVIIGVVLYAVHFIKALNMISLLLSFLALYVAHIASEMVCAWKSFGFASLPPKDNGQA